MPVRCFWAANSVVGPSSPRHCIGITFETSSSTSRTSAPRGWTACFWKPRSASCSVRSVTPGSTTTGSFQNLICETTSHRFLRSHPCVPLHRLRPPLRRPTSLPSQDAAVLLLHARQFLDILNQFSYNSSSRFSNLAQRMNQHAAAWGDEPTHPRRKDRYSGGPADARGHDFGGVGLEVVDRREHIEQASPLAIHDEARGASVQRLQQVVGDLTRVE